MKINKKTRRTNTDTRSRNSFKFQNREQGTTNFNRFHAPPPPHANNLTHRLSIKRETMQNEMKDIEDHVNGESSFPI